MTGPFLVILAIIAAGLWYSYWQTVRVTTIHPLQKGLLFKRGKFVRVLDAGRHRHLRNSTAVAVVDMRERDFAPPRQTVVTQDKVPLEITVKGRMRVVDPVLARDHDAALRLAIHGSLLEWVEGRSLNDMLSPDAEATASLQQSVAAKAVHFGLEIPQLEVLKVDVSPEAMATLEKARGSTDAAVVKQGLAARRKRVGTKVTKAKSTRKKSAKARPVKA